MERHPLDVLSLLFGLLFTGIALVGLSDLLTLQLGDLRWIGPVLLVAFGLALVLTAGLRRPDETDTATDAPAVVDAASSREADGGPSEDH